MKPNNKQPNTTLLWTIILLIFGILSGIAIWQLTDREELINEPETTVRSTVKNTD